MKHWINYRVDELTDLIENNISWKHNHIKDQPVNDRFIEFISFRLQEFMFGKFTIICKRG